MIMPENGCARRAAGAQTKISEVKNAKRQTQGLITSSHNPEHKIDSALVIPSSPRERGAEKFLGFREEVWQYRDDGKSAQVSGEKDAETW
jgi:hypothetical protein